MAESIYTPPFKATADQVAGPAPRSTVLETLLVLYGKRIMHTVLNSPPGTSDDLYTVPQGKTFFLLFAAVSARISANASSNFIMSISGNIDNRIIALLMKADATVTTVSHYGTFQPTVPLRVLEGEIIRFSSDAVTGNQASGLATIIGYELDLAILNNLQ